MFQRNSLRRKLENDNEYFVLCNIYYSRKKLSELKQKAHAYNFFPATGVDIYVNSSKFFYYLPLVYKKIT